MAAAPLGEGNSDTSGGSSSSRTAVQRIRRRMVLAYEKLQRGSVEGSVSTSAKAEDQGALSVALNAVVVV